MLLRNAFLRALCTCLLVFIPMHFGQICQPFICEPPSSGVGPGRMTNANDVVCDRDVWEYNFMYTLGRVFICLVFVFWF